MSCADTMSAAAPSSSSSRPSSIAAGTPPGAPLPVAASHLPASAAPPGATAAASLSPSPTSPASTHFCPSTTPAPAPATSTSSIRGVAPPATDADTSISTSATTPTPAAPISVGGLSLVPLYPREGVLGCRRAAARAGCIFSGEISANDAGWSAPWGRCGRSRREAAVAGKVAALRAFLLCARRRGLMQADTELEVVTFLGESVQRGEARVLACLAPRLRAAAGEAAIDAFPTPRCEDLLLRRDALLDVSDFHIASSLLLSTLRWDRPNTIQAIFICPTPLTPASSHRCSKRSSSSSSDPDAAQHWVQQARRAILRGCPASETPSDVLVVGTAMALQAYPRSSLESVRFVLVPHDAGRGPVFVSPELQAVGSSLGSSLQESEAFSYLLTKKLPRSAQVVKFTHVSPVAKSGALLSGAAAPPPAGCGHSHHVSPAAATAAGAAQRDFVLKYLRVCEGLAAPPAWRTDGYCSGGLAFRGSVAEMCDDRVWGGCLGESIIASGADTVEFRVHNLPRMMFLGVADVGAAAAVTEHFMKLGTSALAYAVNMEGTGAIYEASTRRCFCTGLPVPQRGDRLQVLVTNDAQRTEVIFCINGVRIWGTAQAGVPYSFWRQWGSARLFAPYAMLSGIGTKVELVATEPGWRRPL